jgi:DNA polymerase III subunit alpha, Gram-positive type
MNSRLIYFDFETTGLNVFKDRVIEYCFKDEKEQKTIQGLIKIKKKLSKEIENITGITDDMLSLAKKIDTHQDKMLSFLDNTHNNYLIAHNGHNFDRFFLQRILKKWETTTKNQNIKFIDTIHLAKYIFPGNKSYSQKNLCIQFNITSGNHRAEADVIALEKLYHILLFHLSSKINIKPHILLNNPDIIYDLLYI